MCRTTLQTKLFLNRKIRDSALWIGALVSVFCTTALAQQTAIAEYAVPTSNSGPTAITIGPDGALWFTESKTKKIGRLTTAGAFTEYNLPASYVLSGITAGPDGALWFTSGSAVGRITTAGVITEYPVSQSSGLVGITLGPDGALWFTDTGTNAIGRMTTAGAVAAFHTYRR